MSEIAKLALTGQPNVGKSTVFNILTGLNQHVGNWPGKTVERRMGSLEHDGVQFSIIDLPGTYCLTAASPEELVTRDYILREKPEVVIVVINAAALERNLYLVAELLALPAPLVIGLNMMDVAEQEGFQLQPEVLAAAIGVPVIPMVAARGEGVHELIDAAVKVSRLGPERPPNRPEVREDHQAVLSDLLELVQDHVPDPYPADWMALKLFEGDEEIVSLMREALPATGWQAVRDILMHHEDAIVAVASGRYEWISRMTRAALIKPRAGRITLTRQIDQVATHPFGGLVMLALVLAVIFGLTYAIGEPLQAWLGARVVQPLAVFAGEMLAGGPPWIRGLVVNGIIGGVGSVFTFVPILITFFLSMGVLEDMGYMARAAYVMDRFMHALGLHGKSFMPLFLGFGCNVPAIMGTRIIESRGHRLLTMMLAPLVPCTARLAVLAVLVPVFFPDHATLASWALTGLPLVVLAISGVLFGRIFLRGEQDIFIMEMPVYHLPNWQTIALGVRERIVAFLHKAATVILAVSIIVWALAMLPHGEMSTSYLAMLGRLLDPIGSFMGLGWRSMVALLTSFVAKENALATLGVLYGIGDNVGTLAMTLSANVSRASGLAFLVAQMLFVPCVATLAAIRQEANSWKWVAINVAFLTILTILGAAAAYRLGLWLL